MDTKSILALLLHPLVLAAAGGFVVDRYLGKKIKSKTLSYGLGAAAGYGAGALVQTFLKSTAPKQVVVAVPQQQVAPQGSDDLMLDFNNARPVPRLPMPAQPGNGHGAYIEPAEGEDESFVGGGVGEGTYSRTSYDTRGIQASIEEAEREAKRRGRS